MTQVREGTILGRGEENTPEDHAGRAAGKNRWRSRWDGGKQSPTHVGWLAEAGRGHSCTCLTPPLYLKEKEHPVNSEESFRCWSRGCVNQRALPSLWCTLHKCAELDCQRMRSVETPRCAAHPVNCPESETWGYETVEWYTIHACGRHEHALGHRIRYAPRARIDHAAVPKTDGSSERKSRKCECDGCDCHRGNACVWPDCLTREELRQLRNTLNVVLDGGS